MTVSRVAVAGAVWFAVFAATGFTPARILAQAAPASPDAAASPAGAGTGSSAHASSTAASPASPAAAASSSAACKTADASAADKEKEKNRQTIRYGMDDEILDLMKSLKADKNISLDADLADVLRQTRNTKLKEGILGFMSDLGDKTIQDDALAIVSSPDEETDSVVIAAMAYEATTGDARALDPIRKILDLNNPKFSSPAVKAIGKIGGKDLEDFLLDYYEKQTGVPIKQDLIDALGSCGSKKTVDKLTTILGNTDEDKSLRYSAAAALGKLGDPSAVPGLVKAANDQTDPNLRNSSVDALGLFDDDGAKKAVVQALRDSYYKARISAAKGAGRKKLAEAIPYLEFRAENDPEPSVKNEALKALMDVGTPESVKYLRDFYANEKNPQVIRLTALSVIVRNDAANSFDFLNANFQKEMASKDQTVFNFIVKELSQTKSPAIEPLVSQLLQHKDYVIRYFGLEAVRLNKFVSLKPLVERLANDPVPSVKARAQSVLDTL